MPLLVEDRALLEAFRLGEEPALARVYDFYSDDVARFLASRAASGMALRALDVESAHQETFVRAFRPESRRAYDGLRPYRPYLLTIARSAGVSLLRASGRVARESVRLEEAPSVSAMPSEAPTPEEELMRSEVRRLVGTFLDQLADGERALARLRFMDGASQEAAASELRLSRQQVRTVESRVRRAFTRFLDAAGWFVRERPAA
jgi:RNA polymerase sigma-70 factor (ECF subfamily)